MDNLESSPQETESAGVETALLDAMKEHGITDLPARADNTVKSLETSENEDKPAASQAAPGSETTSGEPKAEETPATDNAAPGSIEPPADWSDADKTTFKELDVKGQELLLKRYKDFQGDYTRKTTELADARKFHDELSPILKEFEPQFKYHGINATQAVSALLNAQAMLDRDPTTAIKSLIDMYKVDVKSFQPSDEKFVDPEVATLKKELNDLKGQLNQTTQSTRASQLSQVQKAVEDFKTEKDATGNTKYPYFDKVQDAMARLIQAKEASDLPSAYDKAIRLNDELFGKTIKDREAAALKAREEEVRKQTEEAKKKQEGNIKGRNTPTSPKTPVTVEDNLRAAFNSLR